MIVEELYIDGQQVDIKDVSIVRSYKSPYFSDVTQILMDSTYTIKLPQTERNKAIMKYLHEADMNTDFPYIIHKADYIVDGMQIIRNGEVKVLGDFELQVVYGVDRAKYLPLKETKLNEIVPNGTTILEGDWVVKWNKTGMFVSGKKYKYLDSISGERTSDIETIGGVVQPKVLPEEPAASNLKEMTRHPFILSENILALINTKNNTNIDFATLISKLTNKGIILNTLIDNYTQAASSIYTVEAPYTATSSTLRINSGADNLGDFSIYEDGVHINQSSVSEMLPKTFTIDYDFYIYPDSSQSLNFYRAYILHGVPTSDLLLELPYTTATVDGTMWKRYVGQIVQEVTEIKGFGEIYGFQWADKINHLYVYFGNIATSIQNLKCNFGITDNLSNSGDYGRYNCLANLPQITCLDFMQQMLIHTCGFLGYDVSGDLKIYFLDAFKANLLAGNLNNWSGRVSNTKNSKYQFNSNAQRNWIKFNNDKDLTDRKEYVAVSDLTITPEKDLYTMAFDSPLGVEDGLSDYILYEQTVKRSGSTGVSFENKYVGDKWQDAFVKDVSGTAKNINVIDGSYDIYQKLINRPIVKEVSVLLDFYESANIDFTKPVYIEEWGKYCLLLELTAPNNGLCEAKLLLINQTL